MGAWSYGSFENDDALDWVGGLAEDDSFKPISQALDVVIAADGVYLEAPDASIALAAAEVVAALIGNPLPKLPDEVFGMAQGKKAACQRACHTSTARSSPRSQEL